MLLMTPQQGLCMLLAAFPVAAVLYVAVERLSALMFGEDE